MNEPPKPSINPTDFSNQLVQILIQKRKEMQLDDDALSSLIIRFDNAWIGGIFADYEDGGADLSEILREKVKCVLIDRSYENPVQQQIHPTASLDRIPEHIRKHLDFSKSAEIVKIGDVHVAFIFAGVYDQE